MVNIGLSNPDVECESLENFEALMCLGNLASLNESVRARILKEPNFIQVGIETLFSSKITSRERERERRGGGGSTWPGNGTLRYGTVPYLPTYVFIVCSQKT